MPRLRKITLDAPNARVIESTLNPRIARKPVFYAGETVSVDVNTVEATVQADNSVAYETIRTGGANTVGMRLGTTTTLVALGTEFVYSPPPRFQATVAITTAPCVTLPLIVESQAIPTTPAEFAINDFVPAQTNNLTITLTGGVTATWRANLMTQTLPAVTVAVPLQDPDFFRYPGLEIFVAGTCVTFSSTVNTPAAATFTVGTSGSSVSAITISSGGSGYPDGTYNLTFTGGTVTSVAEATCVASGGSIASVTIVTGGNGYVTAPAASLFTPAQQVTSVIPSVQQAVVNDRRQFYWHRPAEGFSVVTLSLSVPTSTATPVTAINPVVRMEYVRIDASGMALWEINVVSSGYGYIGAPAVTVPGHPVSARRRTTSASLSGSNLTVSRSISDAAVVNAEDGSLIPGPDPYHLALSGTMNDQGNSALGVELPTGTYPTTVVTAQGLGPIRVVFPDGNRGRLGRSVRNYGVRSRGGLQVIDLPDGALSPQSLQDLAGRSLICAVIPQRDEEVTDAGNHAMNEAAPDRYAIVRVTFPPFPGGIPQYYVGQTYTTVTYIPGIGGLVGDREQINRTVRGLLNFSTYAPGHGFFEPSIEFLDYGKGYKTTAHISNNAHEIWTYNLRVLSGLRDDHVIDSTPGVRTITAVTTGTLGKDSYIATPFSELATTATRQGETGIETYVQNSGFGYHRSGYFTASVITVSGGIRNLQLTNKPWGYALGEYNLTITGGGGSGATAKMFVERAIGSDLTTRTSLNIYAKVTCAGSNYTSQPTVTSPAPNLNATQTGQVAVTVGGGVGDGRYADPTFSSRQPTVIPKGWIKKGSQFEGPYLASYYGYAASPYLSASKLRAGPVLRTINNNGTIQYLAQGNPFPRGAYFTGEQVRGFESQDGQEIRYPLVFDPSPEPDGTAEGFVIFEVGPDESRNFWRPKPKIFITKTGFGYVTAPGVTLQAPDLSGYFLKTVALDTTAVSKATSLGPRPIVSNSIYIPTAGIPDNGGLVGTAENASLHQLVVTPGPKYEFHAQDMRLRVETLDFSQGNDRLIYEANPPNVQALFDEADGKTVAFLQPRSSAVYATAPTVTTPTFPGFAITSVTVTCQGYYYEPGVSTLVTDEAGSGAVIKVEEVTLGKIKKVTLRNGGSGYSTSPQVSLGAAGFNPRDLPSEFGIKANFTVPTSAANSVLGADDQADGLLEVFENEGGNESVLAQVPVTLAKRVKP